MKSDLPGLKIVMLILPGLYLSTIVLVHSDEGQHSRSTAKIISVNFKHSFQSSTITYDLRLDLSPSIYQSKLQ